MKMSGRYNPLGVSVYLSTFESQKDFLNKGAHEAATVFTSLHISEEFTNDYPQRARAMCLWLAEKGYRVMADVSPKTMEVFGRDNLVELAKELQLHSLRLDYGFSDWDTAKMAAAFPLVVNASTMGQETLLQTKKAAVKGLTALHNFYPRPETGLDDGLFSRMNQMMEASGVEAHAFIAGNRDRRGPLYLGLPTLEKHRNLAPLAAFADLAVNFGIRGIFLGDLTLTDRELELIRGFCENGLLPVPVALAEGYHHLYDRVFTSRPDSPAGTVRFAESREYSCHGGEVIPAAATERFPGCITIDNSLYKRYSGEVQLIRQRRPADERVNVIGQLPEAYLLLADCIQGGSAFRLVPV